MTGNQAAQSLVVLRPRYDYLLQLPAQVVVRCACHWAPTDNGHDVHDGTFSSHKLDRWKIVPEPRCDN